MNWWAILKDYGLKEGKPSNYYDRVILPIRKKINGKLDEVVQKNLSNYGRIVDNKPPLPTEEEANRVQGILQRELSAFLPSFLPNTQIKVTFKLRNPRTDYPKDYTCNWVITGKGLGKIPPIYRQGNPFNEDRTYGQFGSRWIEEWGS